MEALTLLVPVVVAIGAALTYEAPLWAAELIGQRPALVGLSHRVMFGDDLAARILFISAYATLGFALWALPAYYVALFVHPRRGTVVRYRTSLVCGLVLPFLPWLVRRYDALRMELHDRMQLKLAYSDFADKYPTFQHFRRHLEWLQTVNYADPSKPCRQAFAFSEDTYTDALRLLGLKPEHTLAELTARHRALMSKSIPIW